MTLQEHDRACLLSGVWHTIQEKGYTLLHTRGNLTQLETVGCFHSFGAPDVVVHALDETTAKRLLHAYATASRAGVRFVSGRTYTDTESGRCLQLHQITAAYQEMLHIWELFGIEATPWRQLVWTDEAGRWPWSRYAEGDCQLQQCFTAHGYAWGKSRPAYEPRRWDRPCATNADYAARQEQIQQTLVKGGWRTPAQAARTLAVLADTIAHCEEVTRQGAEITQ